MSTAAPVAPYQLQPGRPALGPIPGWPLLVTPLPPTQVGSPQACQPLQHVTPTPLRKGTMYLSCLGVNFLPAQERLLVPNSGESSSLTLDPVPKPALFSLGLGRACVMERFLTACPG